MNIEKLIWIDLEMTGLDPMQDHILEIATVITDRQLQIIAKGPSIVIHQETERLNAMDEWNQTHHRASGLWHDVESSQISCHEAQAQTLEFLQDHVPAHHSPMCGNSICQDRRFMARLMPQLEAYFHYRHLDVSTLKILGQIWGRDIPAIKPSKVQHRAMDDVLASIAELQHYRQYWSLMIDHHA